MTHYSTVRVFAASEGGADVIQSDEDSRPRVEPRRWPRPAGAVGAALLICAAVAYLFAPGARRVAGEMPSTLFGRAALVLAQNANSVPADVKIKLGQAQGLKTEAEKEWAQAKDLQGEAQNTSVDSAHEQEDARKELANASSHRKQAASLRKQAEKLVAEATKLEQHAQAETSEAQSKQEDAKKKAEHAAELLEQGLDLEGKSNGTRASAKETEVGAFTEVRNSRMCVDLPGVLLKGTPANFDPIVADMEVDSHAKCTEWCQGHQKCRQSVFSSEDGSCTLFEEWVAEPQSFDKNHNASYCGFESEKEEMLAQLHKVFDQKPWVPEPRTCTWAGGNCLETHCCAQVCVADWQFSKCEWYTCYQKDEYFAGCATGPPPGGWNGTVLGGHPNTEIAKAEEGKLTQGTKLFCFAVVMWNSGATMAGMEPESVVANNWKDKGLGIMQCDDWAIIDGLPTGSGHNIDSFTQAWQKVKEDGRYKRNDWVVKVDSDAVFFADRLRWHIEALRTPQGSRVYLRNTFFKFHFLGAIEVLTKEAAQEYFDRSWECDQNVGKEGGEDYWMLSCLEGIGIDYQTDYELLHDKYAAQEGCWDDWVVAFHFYKSAHGWNECHDAAYNTWKSKHPDPPPTPAAIAAPVTA